MTDKDLCENCAFKNRCEKYRKCLVLQEKLEISVKECQQLKELLKEWAQFEIEENPNDFTVISERMSELANKTKQAIGE